MGHKIIRILSIVVGQLLLAACVMLWSRAHWHHPSAHLENRTLIIEQHVSQLVDSDQPFAAILGDSLVERAFSEGLCDLPVINAGIGRATAGELLGLSTILRDADPEVRILAAGVNDASRGVSLAEFSEDYGKLVHEFEPTIVVGITGERSGEFNEVIRTIASSAVFVEPLERRFLVNDGIHYTTKGAHEWRRRLNQACSKI